MTQITVKQMAAVKRVAMNVLPLVTKKGKVAQKIVELGEELKKLQEQIDVQQGYVKSFAGGLTTEQLVVRHDGKFEPNSDVLAFDEDKRVYLIKAEMEVNDVEKNLPSEEEAIAAEQAIHEEIADEEDHQPESSHDADPFA